MVFFFFLFIFVSFIFLHQLAIIDESYEDRKTKVGFSTRRFVWNNIYFILRRFDISPREAEWFYLDRDRPVFYFRNQDGPEKTFGKHDIFFCPKDMCEKINPKGESPVYPVDVFKLRANFMNIIWNADINSEIYLGIANYTKDCFETYGSNIERDEGWLFISFLCHDSIFSIQDGFSVHFVSMGEGRSSLAVLGTRSLKFLPASDAPRARIEGWFAALDARLGRVETR